MAVRDCRFAWMLALAGLVACGQPPGAPTQAPPAPSGDDAGTGAAVDVAPAPAPAEPVRYRLEPEVSVVTGRVAMREERGPPGFGESPDDPVVRVPVLQLDAPIEVEDGATTRRVDALQLAGSGASGLAPGCRRVRGTLFPAETGHHYTEVLIQVADSAPSDACARANDDAASCLAGDFGAAWRAFRDALARRDCAALVAHARLPLAAPGLLDDDPVQTLDRAALLAACPAWVDADAGLPRASRPLADYAASPDSAAPDWRIAPGVDDQARIGALEFARESGCWRWTAYYRQ